MTEEQKRLLAQAYLASNGIIKAPHEGLPPADRDAAGFLADNHYLVQYSSHGWILTRFGLRYVEINELVDADSIQRDQQLREGLLNHPVMDEEGMAWRQEMIANGYTEKAIDERYWLINDKRYCAWK